VQSVKLLCQEVLLPIIGREHELCCVKSAESRNTVVFFQRQQMKMFIPEEEILSNITWGFLPLFCSFPVI
jgi:hypothetical protein